MIEQPRWVTAARPRSIQRWTADTTVWVTTWGDCVHLYHDCPGTKGFGSDGEAHEVRLRSKICAARRGCERCFGQFFNASSLNDLEIMLIKLHGGRVDTSPEGRTRSIIAEKIRRRGLAGRGANRDAGADGNRSAPVSSSGRTKAGSPKPARAGAGRPNPAPSKNALKKQRQRAEAARLGISVKELKARRRAAHAEAVAKKQRRPSG